MSNIILDGFDNLEDIVSEYQEGSEVLDKLKRADFVFATYETEFYEGYSHFVFKLDGKIYEVNGSHCSCYGLEDQWVEEETVKEAILMRKNLDSRLREFLSDLEE